MAPRKLLLGTIFSHVIFTAVEILLGGAWMHEYTKLRTVSLRDVNSLACMYRSGKGPAYSGPAEAFI